MKQIALNITFATAVLAAFTLASSAQGLPGWDDPNSAGGGACKDNAYNCRATPNPLPDTGTVWLEEMTWMDVRDAMAGGKTTIIIATGGIEPNGPWLELGKHNNILHANCEAIARKLGDALCAPIIKFVPEGEIDPPSGHMMTAGTISLRQETFEALLNDMTESFQVGGFENVILIGDSGGNQRGMAAVAEKLDGKSGVRVVHIPQYYDYESVGQFLRDKGAVPENMESDGLHDDYRVTLNMMADDLKSVRWQARVNAGLATINGISIAEKDKTLALAHDLVNFRADSTVAAIKAVLAE